MENSSQPAGVVYVLTNESLDPLVKIGYTTRSAAIRAKELSTTGLPTPFKVAFESERIENVREVERAVHNKHKNWRVNNGREFFRMSVDEAIESIKQSIEDRAANAPASEPYTVTVAVPEGVTEIVVKLQKVSL